MTEEHRRPGRPRKIMEDQPEAPVLVEQNRVWMAEPQTTEVSSDEPSFFHGTDDLPSVETMQESPTEQKIHELTKAEPVKPSGWIEIGEDVTTVPPRNGTAVWLSEKPGDTPVLAYWLKTRAYANSAPRGWRITGKWVDFNTGATVAFEPKYWKGRYD